VEALGDLGTDASNNELKSKGDGVVEDPAFEGDEKSSKK